jgi:TolA-binding protein
MSDDILKEASRALRELSAEDNQGDRFTRARVMASLHQRRQRHGVRMALLAPLAAVLVGSTAWAGATGGLPRVWVVVADAVGVVHAPEPARAGLGRLSTRRAAKLRRAAHSSRAPRRTEPQPAAAQAAGAEADEQAQRESPDRASAGSEHRVGGPNKPRVAGPDALALYRAAHRAHFERRQYEAALDGYADYLRVAPAGRFVAEARYNRALCLVHLGRRAEAQAALAPFAGGACGGYRQREARELIAAMQDGDASDSSLQ